MYAYDISVVKIIFIQRRMNHLKIGNYIVRLRVDNTFSRGLVNKRDVYTDFVRRMPFLIETHRIKIFFMWYLILITIIMNLL